MSYAVKEIFYTLQGEGANAGRPAVFCRFSGCNLWNGREADRNSSICTFCDTDFVGTNGSGGGKFRMAEELADAILSAWPADVARRGKRFVVCTGGEPLLQLDSPLIGALHDRQFEVAVETNGTQDVPEGIDWVCISPKARAELRAHSGSELKLVFPQADAPPDKFARLDFKHFFLQPMDGPRLQENTELALRYCLDNPQWKLSIQTHKILDIR